MKTRRVAAVIPAAGTGRRMEAAVPKQFLMLGDIPLLLHSLQVFERAASISQVILVVPKEERERTLSEIIERYSIKKVVKVVADRATLQESVHHGPKGTDPAAGGGAVHGSVRPLLTEELFAR